MNSTFSKSQVIAANCASTSSEMFGEETVIIHFDRGTYFSLRGCAGGIWSALQRPTSVDAILEVARAKSCEASDDLETMLTAFVGQLAEHDLVRESAEKPSRPVLTEELLASFAEPPSLEVYSDLAELIAMDPVHEIDTLTGWPNLPQPESQGS
jgi:hypothetical protein